MKTIHISDLHECPERHKKVMRILDQVIDFSQGCSLFSNSGENFHNSYTFRESTGFNEFIAKMGEIARDIAVATIRGTQGKHEQPGMIETLELVGVKILQPGGHYSLSNKKIIEGVDDNSILQLFGVPHPHKAHLLADKKNTMTLDEANAAINKSMRGLYLKYGAMRSQYPHIKALAVGHGVIQGENTRDIEAIKNSAIYSTEADIAQMMCDFYAWAHYHGPVEFKTLLGGYLGSFAWDYNELDYIPAATIIDWDTMDVQRHELDINIRKKYVMFPGDPLPDMTDQDVYLVNNKTEWTESDCKEKGAGQVKIKTEVEIEHKIRSKNVVEARAYADKFKAVYPDANDRQIKECDIFWQQDMALGKIPQKKVFTPLYCEVHGAKPFMERLGKDTVSIDYRILPNGVTMLVGPGGHGKSSLFDYSTPFTVLFLQPNSLVSTFELDDSYIKGGFMVNDKEYRVEIKINPTLKTPKVEYYAFDENDIPIPGLTGNRNPYDDWILKMFNSPSKYSTSVLHTQFDDNDSKFRNEVINPAFFKSTNIELKTLFHKLAGTDLKPVEDKCRNQAGAFEDNRDDEQKKRDGVAENIPNKQIQLDRITEIDSLIKTENASISRINTVITNLDINIAAIEKQEKENTQINAVIQNINTQIAEETNNKTGFETELSEIGNIDIEDINQKIISMSAKKNEFDLWVKNLADIQKKNSKKRKDYEKGVQDYNIKIQEINKANTKLVEQRNDLRINKQDLINENLRRKTIINNHSAAETLAHKNALNTFNNDKKELENSISSISERITNGQNMIEALHKCKECGFMDDEDVEKRKTYLKLKENYEKGKVELEDTLSLLIEPKKVSTDPDTTEVDEKIKSLETTIDETTIPEDGIIPPPPNVPEYDSEVAPEFDAVEYESLQQKAAGYSEDKITEIRTKITETQKRIQEQTLKLSEERKKLHQIDETPRDSKKVQESSITLIREKIQGFDNEKIGCNSKISHIEELNLSLVEYDKRIEEYNDDYIFWADMREKWGPNGIPARILEHTGPYIDQATNELLNKYYPVYNIHCETIKKDSTGKRDLEVFTIFAINQETGRVKPISSLSGEERQFIHEAIRNSFRKLNKENTLEEWNVLFEDEPDSHVSSDYIQQFWAMMEEISREKKVICVAHSLEVKHHAAITIDIREL